MPLVKLLGFFFGFFLDWVTHGRLLGLWWGMVWLIAAFGETCVTHLGYWAYGGAGCG